MRTTAPDARVAVNCVSVMFRDRATGYTRPLVALCLLASKAINVARNKTNGASGQATSRLTADGCGSALGNFASMIVAGDEDSSSGHPSRRMRKATKARRKSDLTRSSSGLRQQLLTALTRHISR